MKRTLRHIVAIGGVAVATLLLTSAAGDNTYKLGKSVEVLVNLLRNINLFYVDEMPSEKIMNAAAEGMTKILDPYTEYIPAERMAEDASASVSAESLLFGVEEDVPETAE